MLRRAYADAGVNPQDVDYIEAHGTGTILGDPIEASALGRVLGAGRGVETPILLGSAKTNIGHSESAAGVVGLIKVIQAMRNDVIPANINYSAPNRYIDFEAEHLEVVEDPREWPEYSGRKVAGVSGFGFGGTNAHVVLTDYRGTRPNARRSFPPKRWRCRFLAFCLRAGHALRPCWQTSLRRKSPRLSTSPELSPAATTPVPAPS